MAEVRTDAEILGFAIGREIQAIKLYKLLARRASDRQVAQICEEYAQEEIEHKEILELEAMKRGYVVDAPQEPQSDSSISVIPEMEGSLDIGPEEVFSIAIEKEEDAFRFYFRLAAQMKDPEIQELLIQLAQEEARHKFKAEEDFRLYGRQ